MVFRESETTELKETVRDDIKREIVAFANCNRGKRYVGVHDDGTVIGVDDADGVSLQISSIVRDAIKPDLTMLMHHDIVEVDSRQIVPWTFSVEQIVPTILRRRGCAWRAYT